MYFKYKEFFESSGNKNVVALTAACINISERSAVSVCCKVEKNDGSVTNPLLHVTSRRKIILNGYCQNLIRNTIFKFLYE